MKRQEIQAPYKTYTGAILNAEQCERYNAIQRRINSFADAGLPIPEYLVSASHKLFTELSNA